MLYIYTLNWNGEDKLKKLYPTLEKSLKNIEYKWFIKDNNSKDNSVQYLKSLNTENITIIEYNHNLDNFSKGMNYLYKISSPKDDDLILLLNNDVIFNDNKSLHNMINIINSDKNIGVVGAKLVYTNSNLIQHCGVAFHPYNGLPFHIFANNKTSDDSFVNKNRLFQVVTGAVLLTKGSLYKQVHTENTSGNLGMDEDYHWAFDDVDLCLAIRYKMNKKIVYCGQTNISHEESSTLKKNPVNKMFMSQNINRLLEKWKSKYQIDANLYLKDDKYNIYK